MKHIFILLFVLFTGLYSATAQEQVPALPKLSAFTRQYFADRAQWPGKETLPGYVYKEINNQPYLSAFLKVNNNMDQAKLDALGIYVGTKAGNIWVVQIPISNIDAITKVTDIGYIGLDMPIRPFLDSARKQTKADSAQRGIALPMPMTGKNVIVGVIDAGFDLNHPTMYDTTYSKYRIQRVWAQKVAGAPPTGFAYGNEMTDTNVIKARGSDTTILSHGTHVAGIAAGSGYGSTAANNNQYRGMAFESDMVLVGIMPAPSEWAVAGESDIIDGINYIFSYATAQGRPAVINLSWGATIGPHDGNSLFSQACDALTGAGKIFVCAAGNNGEDTVHLQKTFTTADTTVSTFVTFSPYLAANNQQTWVDVWGDSSSTFCFTVKLYNANTAVDSTVQICLADTTRSFMLKGTNGDTCFVTASMTDVEYNGKPHALLHFYSRVTDNICLTTTAKNAVVNMWEGYVLPPEGYYGYLLKLGYPWAVSGDANMTVSDIGCTRSAITVAAYTSKTSFRNIANQVRSYSGAVHGKIAPFSSFGPTEDLRIKPDIAAPGFALASAVNSYDTSYNVGGPNYSSIVHAYTANGRTYNYAMLAGTSMASPCVAGIVAMMLQMNPLLSPDSVKAILSRTAILDAYTGALPAAGNTTWGHGKINAYKALQYLATKLSVENTLNEDPLACILYPNPNKGGFTISYTSSTKESVMVSMYDITGRLVNTQMWQVGTGSNTHQFNLGQQPNGVYFIKLSGAKGYKVMKMTVQ